MQDHNKSMQDHNKPEKVWHKAFERTLVNDSATEQLHALGSPSEKATDKSMPTQGLLSIMSAKI
jgi:hypothetical protein